MIETGESSVIVTNRISRQPKTAGRRLVGMQKATKIGDQWLVFGGGGLILRVNYDRAGDRTGTRCAVAG